jgi:hypothetical protein
LYHRPVTLRDISLTAISIRAGFSGALFGISAKNNPNLDFLSRSNAGLLPGNDEETVDKLVK